MIVLNDKLRMIRKSYEKILNTSSGFVPGHIEYSIKKEEFIDHKNQYKNGKKAKYRKLETKLFQQLSSVRFYNQLDKLLSENAL